MALGLPSTLPGGEPTVFESLRDLLSRGVRSFSFEFFPPKDNAGEEQLWTAVRRLERLQPTFVSVTYGAGGSTRDRTVRIIERLARDTTMTPVAHLTCVAATVPQLRQVIGQYADAGVRNVLALRGDPPQVGPFTPHPQGLQYADELVALLRETGNFCVGVAAFPDSHPESPNLEHDAQVLVRKAQAGAEFAITQMFFDVAAYRDLVARVRAQGCDMPIIPGLMPITSLPQIERVAALVGAAVPEAIVSRLRSAGPDPTLIRRAGLAIATELAQDLLDAHAPGLHFYTLNRSTATMELFEGLRL